MRIKRGGLVYRLAYNMPWADELPPGKTNLRHFLWLCALNTIFRPLGFVLALLFMVTLVGMGALVFVKDTELRFCLLFLIFSILAMFLIGEAIGYVKRRMGRLIVEIVDPEPPKSIS